MTSRISFMKHYRENIKHHLTSLFVVTFAFIIHFITMFMHIQNYLEYDYELDFLILNFTELVEPGYANGIFAMAIGLFMAFDYFKYLHYRKETDFYESIPILRKDRFILHFCSCFSIFLLLSFITCGMELMVINLFKISSASITKAAFWNFICMNLNFLASYFTAVLAIVMTGNLLIALLGYGAFCVYIPIIIGYLFPSFAEIYFNTYDSMPMFGDIDFHTLTRYFSPATLMYELNSNDYTVWLLDEHIRPMIIIAVFTIIIGIISFVLYLKRPSEAAGKAIAFESSSDVIRILIVIPFSLYIGLFLRQMAAVGAEIWFFFGIIFGGFVIHGILEAVFQFDIKAVFTKKRQLLFAYSISLLFVSIFIFDLLQFESYIPKENRVETVFIRTDALNGYYEEYKSDGLQGENIVLTLQVAEELNKLNANSSTSEYDYNTDSIVISYQMKNGITRTRTYWYAVESVPKALDQISASLEFKEIICEYYHLDINNISETEIDTGEYYHESSYYITSKEILTRLQNAYLSEYEKFSISEYYSVPVVCEIVMNSYDQENDYYYYYRFPVYANFAKTISILEETGFTAFKDKSTITVKQLENYDDDKDGEVIIIDDPDKLSQMKSHLYLCSMNYHLPSSKFVYLNVFFEHENGETYCDAYIDKDIYNSIMN